MLLPPVSSNCNDRDHSPRHGSSFVPSAMADLSEGDVAKQLQTPVATHCMDVLFIVRRGGGGE